MPHPDQFFFKSLRSSPRDVGRNRSARTASPTPQLRGNGAAATTPRRAVTPSSLATNRSRMHGVVPSSNITTSAPALSQLDNRFSAANVHQRSTPNFIASPRRQSREGEGPPTVGGASLGTPSDADHLRFQHQWSHSSSLSGGGIVHRRYSNDAGRGRDDDDVPMLQALERTLESEMEELRALTDRLESRVASVMSLEDQRHALIRVLHHTRHQQQEAAASNKKRIATNQSLAHSTADGSIGSSAVLRRSKPLDSPGASYIIRNPEEDDAPSIWEATPSPKRFLAAPGHAPTPPQAASSTPSRNVDDDVVVLSELGAAVSLTDSGRKHRHYNGRSEASTNIDTVLLRSAQRVGHRSTTSHESTTHESPAHGIFVLDLSDCDKTGTHREGRNDTTASSAANRCVAAQLPDATEEGRTHPQAPSPRGAPQPISSSLLLTAQCHGTLADLLKYEEELLGTQDELIQMQREGREGTSEAERVLLMHLRVVVRDELSACKVRESTLRGISDALERCNGSAYQIVGR